MVKFNKKHCFIRKSYFLGSMIYELFKSLVIVRDSKIKILKILFTIN